MQKVSEKEKRLWYAQQTIENGWSRSMMISWIESDLHSRQGKAITNFKKDSTNSSLFQTADNYLVLEALRYLREL